jgi:DNA-binding NarL/FixJ family response regulator
VTTLPASALVALTPDERAVVELVVRGLHNKEIAARLFVSVRTVELRLTHVYRKLGARSRSHLVALLR